MNTAGSHTASSDGETLPDSTKATAASTGRTAAGTLFFLGANHHTTPLELREKLALAENKLATFHAHVATLEGIREVAILNTCNRVEFYGIAESPGAILRLEEAFCQHQQFPTEHFKAIRQHSIGQSAIQHLLEVASGLNSQMLGETEILGQVKEAYAEAQERRTTGPALNRLFQKTFQYAKYVRTHTAITEGHVSIANVAVDLAQKIFGKLTRTRILLLGAGEISEKTAKAFQSRGAPALTVASRTLERAMALATELKGTALPFENVPLHLADFDIVVCSTAAPHAVVTCDAAQAAMRKRRAHPLFFIDLALPRDVEPEVADLENVFLYNLDDLARIAAENRHAREAEVSRAKIILQEKSASLWQALERIG